MYCTLYCETSQHLLPNIFNNSVRCSKSLTSKKKNLLLTPIKFAIVLYSNNLQ